MLENLCNELLILVFSFLAPHEVTRCERLSSKFSYFVRSNREFLSKFEDRRVRIRDPLFDVDFIPRQRTKRQFEFKWEENAQWNLCSPSRVHILDPKAKKEVLYFKISSELSTTISALRFLQSLSKSHNFKEVIFRTCWCKRQMQVLYDNKNEMSKSFKRMNIDSLRFQWNTSPLDCGSLPIFIENRFFDILFLYQISSLEIGNFDCYECSEKPRYQVIWTEINDDILWRFRGLRHLVIKHCNINVSVKSVRRIVDAWKIGESYLKELELDAVNDKDLNKEKDKEEEGGGAAHPASDFEFFRDPSRRTRWRILVRNETNTKVLVYQRMPRKINGVWYVHLKEEDP